ncbi:MAG: hypothetical protein KY475_26520 [Planctomycetes bacterium]|nr:hypothetical protein [Planctomycetota bacterium]
MFEVRWLQSALDELAEIWLLAESGLRADFTSAAAAIDDEVSRNPATHGESRGGDERIFFVDPLGLRYEIDFDRSLVFVYHVWKIRRSR